MGRKTVRWLIGTIVFFLSLYLAFVERMLFIGLALFFLAVLILPDTGHYYGSEYDFDDDDS